MTPAKRQARNARIVELYEDGCIAVQISGRLGCDISTVYAAIKATRPQSMRAAYAALPAKGRVVIARARARATPEEPARCAACGALLCSPYTHCGECGEEEPNPIGDAEEAAAPLSGVTTRADVAPLPLLGRSG